MAAVSAIASDAVEPEKAARFKGFAWPEQRPLPRRAGSYQTGPFLSTNAAAALAAAVTLAVASPAWGNPLPTVRVGLQAAARDGGPRALPIRLGLAVELRWTFGRRGRLLLLRDRPRPDLPLPPTPEIEALIEDGWLEPEPLETTP